MHGKVPTICWFFWKAKAYFIYTGSRKERVFLMGTNRFIKAFSVTSLLKKMMRKDRIWSDTLLKLVSDLNNFNFENPSRNPDHASCAPFYIDKFKVGIVQEKVLEELTNFPDVFKIISEESGRSVHLNETLCSVEARSDAFGRVLQELRKKDKFVTLKGWRNETYSIYYKLCKPPLCHVERSGCEPYLETCLNYFHQYVRAATQTLGDILDLIISLLQNLDTVTKPVPYTDHRLIAVKLDHTSTLFGFIQYGVHVNGYTYKDGQLMMWVGRRSSTKPTYPNMLDNMCAGGLASGLGVTQCAIKECQEEGSVDDETLKQLKSAGSISYCFIDKRGILPETQYVYDLEVSPDFVPKNADGEMQSFELCTVEQIQNLIIAREFKPNCALVIVDFLIRHGYITPDEEPHYSFIIQRMHTSLLPLYTEW